MVSINKYDDRRPVLLTWLSGVLIRTLAALLFFAIPGKAQSGTLLGKIEVTQGKKDENTVVYLREVKGNYGLPQKPAVMDQKGKVFIPHLLPVQQGQTLRFKNSDTFSHNAHVYWGRRSMSNQSQPPNGYTDWTPARTGEYLILCNIHEEMSAFLLVLNHPFFAEAASSEFKIENIPEGTYTLVAVRDVKGNLKEKATEVVIKSGETTRVTIQH